MRTFEPKKIPIPPDFQKLKINPLLPLDVEIGCGVGFHPLQYARNHPERQLVAIERTKEKYEKFLGRIEHHPKLPNLIPIHGDAIAWIVHGIARESVDQYFILYPNPYPKESQRNLRFHEMPFFSFLLTTMKPGGKIVVATNKEFYAKDARDRMVGHWGLSLLEDRVIGKNEIPRTHFEKKYLVRGEVCWNLVFKI